MSRIIVQDSDTVARVCSSHNVAQRGCSSVIRYAASPMLGVHVHQLPWPSAGYSGVESLEHRHKVNQIDSDGSAAPGRKRSYVGFGGVLDEGCWRRSVQERV